MMPKRFDIIKILRTISLVAFVMLLACCDTNSVNNAKQNPNDADRLRKYLARFGLTWERLRGGPERAGGGV